MTPIVTALYYTPLAVGGIIISSLGGLVLHRLPGTILLVISATGSVVASLLFALIPASPSLTVKFWAFIMPAMVAGTIGIDITWTVTNVFITTSLPARHQAAGGAMIHSLFYLGVGFWQGVGSLVVSAATKAYDLGLRESYGVAFWMNVAVGGIVWIMFWFVRVDRAESALTVDEKEAIEEQNRHEGPTTPS